MGMYFYVRGSNDESLQQLRVDPTGAVEYLTDSERSFMVGKAWGALGSILFGDSTGLLMLADAPLDEAQDYGYGPVLVLEPATTRRLAAALAEQTLETVREGLALAQAQEAYPYFRPLAEDEVEGEVAELWDLVQELRAYVEPIAARGERVLALMS